MEGNYWTSDFKKKKKKKKEIHAKQFLAACDAVNIYVTQSSKTRNKSQDMFLSK